MVLLLVSWLAACENQATQVPDTAPPSPVGEGLQFAGPVPKNILVLSVDTFRRDHLGRYRDGASYTPFLDELMAEAFVVDDAVACSDWTIASTACVMSGADNLDRAEARQMVPVAGTGNIPEIPRGEEMLPVWLREGGGFESALFTTNGFFSGQYGNAQGFDRLVYDGPGRVAGTWESAKPLILAESGGTPLSEPWYLHFHFFEPHEPYTPPEEYLGALDALPDIPFDLSTKEGQDQALNSLLAGVPPDVEVNTKEHFRVLYAAEVTFFDAQLRDMWAELDELGFLDDALVVFWTDHGEELWEHDVTQHAKLLFAQENDMGLFFWARNLAPGSWDGPVTGSDIAPTLLRQHGLEIPDTVTGIPIGEAPSDRVRFVWTDGYLGPAGAVIHEGVKLHFRWGGQQVFVFDRATDRAEQSSIYDAANPQTLDLWALLKPKIEEMDVWVQATDTRNVPLVWPPDLP